MTLPSGWQAGDLAVAMAYGAATGDQHLVSAPTGWTSLGSGAGGGDMTSLLFSRVLAAGDTTVATTAGYGLLVAVYRHAAVGAYASEGGVVTDVGGSGNPLTCKALKLGTTDRSSWVACLAGDDAAGTNVSTAASKGLTNRDVATDTNTALADSHGPVTSWAGADWGGDNFALPGSHGVVVWSLELLSQ